MLFRALFLVLVVLYGCGRIPVATDPDAEVPGGRIAFIGGGDELNFQLYVMWSDGTGLKTVLPDVDPRSDFSGQSWSPDGKQLVFASNLGGNANFDIYTMGLDGGQLTRIVGDSGGDFAPSWSPTGNKVAFQAKRSAETGWDIYVVNVDGSNERNITQSAEDEEVVSWSPDGAQLVCQMREIGGTSIYVMDVDGQNRRLLVAGGGRVAHETPAWSPDGRRIAFASNLHQAPLGGQEVASAEFEIYTVAIDGSDLRRITYVSDPLHAARWPTWDPSGKTLAFEFSEVSPVTVQTYWYIATVNHTGSNFKKVTMSRQGRVPRWAPQ
jgi:Tol biopolymer transport system component